MGNPEPGGTGTRNNYINKQKHNEDMKAHTGCTGSLVGGGGTSGLGNDSSSFDNFPMAPL